MKEDKIEKLHADLLKVYDEMRTLVYAVSMYNPGLCKEEKTSLPAIAQSLGDISQQLAVLRIEAIQAHEKAQIENA